MHDAQRHLLEVMGRAAPRYDRMGPAFFTEIAVQLLRRARIEETADVLDVATGPGVLLAQLDGHRGRLVGVDLSRGMVDEARSRLPAEVELIEMDAEALSFADETFDRALCSAALQQLPHPERAANELHRVLRPGGVAAASVFGRTDSHWRGKDDLFSRLGVSTPRVGAIFDAQRLRALFEDAGFAGVDVDAEHLDVRYADADEWLESAWSHGERRGLETLGEGSYDEFRLALPAALAPARETDGALHWRPEVLFVRAVKT